MGETQDQYMPITPDVDGNTTADAAAQFLRLNDEHVGQPLPPFTGGGRGQEVQAPILTSEP